MIFKTEWIDSKWDKKWLDRIAMILGIIFIFLAFNPIFKWLDNPLAAILMSSLWVFYIYYSLKRRKHYRKLGKLELNNDGIVVIADDKSMIYNWGVLKHVQIIRGCRSPGWDSIPNYVHSNYIRFLFKEANYEFEFSIKTKSDHKAFEVLIQSLFDQGIKLDYKSI